MSVLNHFQWIKNFIIDFRMREYHLRPNTVVVTIGASGAGIFDIKYVTQYPDPNTGTPIFGDFYEVTLANRLNGR